MTKIISKKFDLG